MHCNMAAACSENRIPRPLSAKHLTFQLELHVCICQVFALVSARTSSLDYGSFVAEQLVHKAQLASDSP